MTREIGLADYEPSQWTYTELEVETGNRRHFGEGIHQQERIEGNDDM